MAVKPKKKQMTAREQIVAIFKVAKLTFQIAPGAVLFKLAGAVVDAVVPIATAFFAAQTTTSLVAAFSGDESARSMALAYIILTALLGLFGMAWSSIDQYIQANMRYRVEAKVSDRMYGKFLSLEFWRYDDKETADLYDKAQKFAQFFAWIFDRLASLAAQIITVIASIVALSILNGWVALAIFVAIIPSVLIQFRLSRVQIDHWNDNVNARRTKNMIEWNLLQPDTATELRLYGLSDYLIKLRSNLRDKDEKSRLDFEKKFIPKRLVANGLQSVIEVGALIWVAFEIFAQRQPVGQFIYVQQVVSRAMSGAAALVSIVGSIDEDVANLFEYEQFMELASPNDRSSHQKSSPEIINIDHIYFNYPSSDRTILEDVSLTIAKNQHIAIVGENGAGKSTLIKLIAGIYKPTKGQILVDEKPLDDIVLSEWHDKLAILNQDFTRYTFTNVRSNVLFGKISKHDKEDLKKSLAQAEAAEFVEKLSKGLDTELNKWNEDDDGNPGTNLSGGQWQRLALARNFYRDAPVIILDEPTSAIDALAESRIFSRLFKEKNKTIITISHRLTTVKKADVIYMMKNGKIVERGTCDELVAKKGEFYSMFESQI